MASEEYIHQLISQGQNRLNICPNCFANGTRERLCKNAVFLRPENVLVCCWLGDKHEITQEEFRRKVREMTENNKGTICLKNNIGDK